MNTINTSTGPRTAEGKRIAARNATTHGLFARDVVLPRLGEDPQAYELFLAELNHQLKPKNLLEQHYAEKIAAASWRLRRLLATAPPPGDCAASTAGRHRSSKTRNSLMPTPCTNSPA